MRKICVVTGTRAEYGLLYWVLKKIGQEPSLKLQLIVTGAHLSPEFGLTYQEIEKDRFTIDAKVEMLLSSDTAVGIAKSIGLGVIGFAETLERLKPDLLLVLGDRYEILAAAEAALAARIPVGHIGGGDTSEGAMDESIRHSITKMSHLHFATNEESAKRILQMGENPAYVFNTGSPGIDYLKQARLFSAAELEKELGFKFLERNLLVTYHPVTLEEGTSAESFTALLDAIDALGDKVGVIFTKPNSDTDGRIIMQLIDEYVKTRPNAKAFTSLGQRRYLSAIACADAVVGNSSSGLYEVPSFGKPTVDIGDRQKGRLKAASVISCGNESAAIYAAIKKAFASDFKNVVNPYGDGTAALKIVSILKSISDYKQLLKKHFYLY